MNLTKKKISAAHRIIVRARSFDTMLAGEIPTDNGVIVTDGIVTAFSPVSFGEPRCLTNDPVCAGGYLLSKLKTAVHVEKSLVQQPFELKKVASTISSLCKQYSITDRFKKTTINIDGMVFETNRLIDAFDVVGRKACGYIARNSDLFDGSDYLVIEPESADYENDIYAIVLPQKNTLSYETITGKVDKVQKAIERIRNFEPQEGYYLAFSGGKDSQCVYHLAKMAGVKFDAHYSLTTVDPPELMRFIRKNYPDVIWERQYWPDNPKYNLPSGQRRQITMWNLIANHTIPPTRQARYCCSALKEVGGKGRLVITGVRWAESIKRRDSHGIVDVRTTSKSIISKAKENNPAATTNSHDSLIFMDDNDESKRMVEFCYVSRKTTLNPIIDWEDNDVWEFLNEVAKVPHCSLYDEGYERLGCIGCPLAGRENMLRDFERWPRYKELYIKAFDKMINSHPGEIKVATGEATDSSGGRKIFVEWVKWNF